jgi:hypothetical protein
MTPYLPTYLSILILIGIFTAQQFTNIANTNPRANAIFFMALALVMALINLLLGMRAAWLTLGVAVSFWVVGLVIGIFTGGDTASTGLPRCGSASASRPVCPPPQPPPCEPECEPQCMQCGPYDTEIECVDIQCA